MIDAYGDETSHWVGKEVKVWIIKSMIGGKLKDVIYLTAPDWVEGEDGFVPPTGKKIEDKDIPVINEESDVPL